MAYNGELTPEQVEGVRQEEAHWVEVALSTDRCDRDAGTAAVRQAYQTAGLDEPRAVLWTDSPYAGGYLTHIIREACKDTAFQKKIRRIAGLPARGDMLAQLHAQPEAVGRIVTAATSGELRVNASGVVGSDISPWWDCYWVALYRQASIISDVTIDPRLTSIAEVLENTGRWWPMVGVSVISDRPTLISRDAQGRLHSEDGPSLEYSDGYAVWSWHGTLVPKGIITGEMPIDEVMQLRNAEQRRCGIERYGWDRLADRMTLVSSAPDPGNPPYTIDLYDIPREFGRLYDSDDPVRIMLVTNGSVERDGTRRRFGLPVPGHHSDPIEAAAELYGWPRAAYEKLQVRR